MACILLWSSAVRVHDSQAYRKMDVTRERISSILELREILKSFQTGFNLVSAAVVCAILGVSLSVLLLSVLSLVYHCQCCCCLCYPGGYLRLGTLINCNWAQVLQACGNLKLLSICFDLCVDEHRVFSVCDNPPKKTTTTTNKQKTNKQTNKQTTTHKQTNNKTNNKQTVLSTTIQNNSFAISLISGPW